GRGERFWPQSRQKRPKHLQAIVGESTMLAQTLDRLSGLVPAENIFIITNCEQRATVLEDCPQLRPDNVVGEPIGRDTAAAVALATVLVKRQDPTGVFALLPADHVIHNAPGFQDVLGSAFEAAEREPVLVTVGIKPTAPATGYGYIERADIRTKLDGGRPLYDVKRFVEKPDLKTAETYLASGNYFWNAGMFVWSVKAISSAFQQCSSEHFSLMQSMEQGLDAGKSLNTVLEELYPKLEKISIDYAIMEKADNVVTVESDFDWDDVGEWPAVARHYEPDAKGNVLRGDVVTQDAKGNIVISSNGHLTALLGVEDLIVVHTEDATLVCPKDQAQSIKQLVKTIEGTARYKTHL
ncbi:MAG TPA: mannose-1-phosphate guanyltransferase, partial [Opitutae bacterium]|nr:mannose-1-phosphate guanyltransferase [Opitutae bacterium]